MTTHPQTKKWYYSENNKERKGPLPQLEIEALINTGKVKKTFLCWADGMAAWAEIGRTAAFSAAFEGIEDDIKKIESLTGSLPPPAAEKRRRKRAPKKGRWKTIESHTNVYVTGLPPATTEAELAAFFGKCGIIRKDPASGEPRVKVYRDEGGAAKGDGLVSYLKGESVSLAIDLLDDAFLTPSHRVRVQKAEFRMKGEVYRPKEKGALGGAEDNAVKRITIRKIAKAKDQNKELCWDEEQEKEIADKVGLRIVILKPMFSAAEAKLSSDEDKYYDDLGVEVGIECERVAGAIDKLTVFRGSDSGAVAVKFKAAYSAAKCIAAMDKRFFAGRPIVCEYFDGTDYRAAKGGESKEDEQARLDKFGDWLEGKDAKAAVTDD